MRMRLPEIVSEVYEVYLQDVGLGIGKRGKTFALEQRTIPCPSQPDIGSGS